MGRPGRALRRGHSGGGPALHRGPARAPAPLRWCCRGPTSARVQSENFTSQADLRMATQNDLPDITIDSKGLYREDVFTDRRAGSIRRLTPVTVDGSTDPSRPVLLSGQTQFLTPAGVLPLGFEIEAKSLDEALQKFPEGVKVALEQAIDEAREMRREAASRIVVPEVGGGVGPGPGAGAGGKIKFP